MAAIIICSTFISVCIAGFDKSISIATENDPYSYLLLLLNKKKLQMTNNVYRCWSFSLHFFKK